MTTPNPLVKFWPLGAFLAAVGYCVWPYVAPEPRPMPPPPPMPKIDASWLKPTFGPPVDRNPFLPPGAEEAPPPVTVPAADGLEGRDGVAGTGPTPGNGASPPERAEGRPSPRAGPTPAFSLGATMVSGPRRAAIINGRVYRQGERLPGADGEGWTVDWVEPGRVLLGRPGRRDPIALEMAGPGTLLADRSKSIAVDRPDPDAPGPVLKLDLDFSDARTALAAAGVNLPMPHVLEQLAERSGGSLSGAYRALLDLLISPPGPAPTGGPKEDRP